MEVLLNRRVVILIIVCQVNRTIFCESLFANRPADLDWFIGVLRYVLSLFPMEELLGFISGFKNAYRQCSARPAHAAGCILVRSSFEHNKQVFGIPGAQLFGCS